MGGVTFTKLQLAGMMGFAIAFSTAVGLVCFFARPSESPDVPQDPLVRPSESPDVPQPWQSLLLPKYTTPLHYDITLYPDFYDSNHMFYGNVSIDVKVDANLLYMLVHYKDLDITSVSLINKDTGEDYGIADSFKSPENQFWVTKARTVVPENSVVVLTLRFSGDLNNGIVGLYKSSYVNSKTNKTRYLATSKFEPVDARKAFPCFDEPNLKATFTVTVWHQPAYRALSNMPQKPIVANVPGHPGLVTASFEKSVPMSTYLVCFIVCDFEFKNLTTERGIEFRVYATPDKIDMVDYALRLGRNVTDFYESYFQMDYPLPKMDMIAIPDFVSGAMEHWGLITYRETSILLDETLASSANRQRVANVVAHELAHQWFGNIVTMDWWDDLWLNEGFASFMEIDGVDEAHSDWDMDGQFVSNVLHPVLPEDSVVSSHPIIVPVFRPEDITAVFDSISYNKGSAIIRMLQSWLGKENFVKGVNNYLRKYEYGNAKTKDLWEAMDQMLPGGVADIKDLSVRAVMDTWTLQMGFPLITLFQRGDHYYVNQTRFLADKDMVDTTSSPFDYMWKMILIYNEEMNSKIDVPLPIIGEQETQLSGLPNSYTGWIKVNPDNMGYYRTNYPLAMWELFKQELLSNYSKSLSTGDRAGLVNDAIYLARGGYNPYSSLLSFMEYLTVETEYVPWDSAYSGIRYLHGMMEEEQSWKRYVGKLLSNVTSHVLHLQDDPININHLDGSLIATVSGLSCATGQSVCLDAMSSLFTNYFEDSTVTILPDIRRLMFHYGMRNVSLSNWTILWSRYQTEKIPQEKSNLLYGITQTQNIDIIERLLAYAMDPLLIRDQDYFTVISYMSVNKVANPIVWAWFQENWPKLVERFGIDHRYLGRILPSIVSGYKTPEQLREVEAYIARFPDAGAGSRSRIQAIERIQSNIQWIKKYKKGVLEWLTARSY